MMWKAISWRDIALLFVPLVSGVLLLIGGLMGCADPDGSVGSDVLGGRMSAEPREMVLYPKVDTLSWTQVPTGNSNYLHLGHIAGFHSAILLKFTSFPTLKDTFVLDSAVVTLTPNQVFRDSVIFHQGFVRLSWVTDEWSEGSVVLDSLPNWGMYPSLEVPWSITPADSEELVLSLSPAVVRSWIDGDTTNQGLLLEMVNEPGFCRQYFASEATVSYRPTLDLYYTWYDSGEAGWQEYQSDTTAYAIDDAFIVTDDIEIADDILMIGNGVSYRSLLWFNVTDSLPIFGVSIHRADLTLHIDPDHPLTFRSVPSGLRQRLESLSWLEDPLHPDVSGLVSQSVLLDTASFTIGLSGYVRDWIEEPSENFGVLIRSDNEGWDVAREVFYSRAAADTAVWPELRIVYTLPEP
jgi:hypothetical protein